MDSIWQILTHTPWWVFVLFFYLLKVGIDATKPRVVSMKKLFILPAVFLAISINSLISSFSIGLLTLAVYATSLAIGIIGGWALVRNLNLHFDHKHHLVKMPGSFVPLILVLTIFSTKYYLGYLIATHPEIVQKVEFTLFQLAVSGLCTGLFLGRLGGYLLRKSQSCHENLLDLNQG